MGIVVIVKMCLAMRVIDILDVVITKVIYAKKRTITNFFCSKQSRFSSVLGVSSLLANVYHSHSKDGSVEYQIREAVSSQS